MSPEWTVTLLSGRALSPPTDAHGNAAIHLFNLSLVRDPQVNAAIDDVVVEFGNAKYQDIFDRFQRGDDVP
jgi:hypothetical protein